MLKNKVKSALLLAAVLAWMAVIFSFSAETGASSGSRSTLIAQQLIDWGVVMPLEALSFLIRKTAHFTVYFVLGVLTYLFFNSLNVARKFKVGLSMLVVFLYAVSDEVHQLFIDERAGQVSDVLLDTLGGVTAIVITSFLIKNLGSRKTSLDD